eukprot:2950481-Amphidinium_carterae.1
METTASGDRKRTNAIFTDVTIFGDIVHVHALLTHESLTPFRKVQEAKMAWYNQRCWPEINRARMRDSHSQQFSRPTSVS